MLISVDFWKSMYGYAIWILEPGYALTLLYLHFQNRYETIKKKSGLCLQCSLFISMLPSQSIKLKLGESLLLRVVDHP